jgi:hypothetical protein
MTDDELRVPEHVNGNGNCGSDREVISRENIRKYREKA